MSGLWEVVFLLELTKCLLIGDVFFALRGKRYWIIAAAALGYFGVLCWKTYSDDAYTLWNVMFVVVCLWCLLDTGIARKLIGIIKILFIASCMDGIVSEILKLIYGAGFTKNVSYYVIHNILSIFIIILILMIKRKCVIKRDGILKIVISICAVTMGSSVFITIPILRMWVKESGNIKSATVVHILIMAYYCSIMMLLLFLFYVNNNNHKMKRYLETERFLKETQKNYYEMMLEKEEVTRRFRHDMINHFLCLHELIRQEKKEEVLDYLEKLNKGMNHIQHKCYYVGNSVIDAMMNYYFQLLEKDVSISVLGTYEKEADMNQVELCAVFSNLIKNAIEELNRQIEGEKYLKILFHCGLDTIKIEIENSTLEVIEKIDNRRQKNNLPKSVKKDYKHHGFGLKNVTDIIEKHHGIFLWEHSGSYFKATVILPCKNRS